VARDKPQVSFGGLLGHDFGIIFGKCTMCAKEGKIVGALSRINACKGRKTVEAIRNFGSIDKG
jgi:hypothetical protein